MATRKPNSTDGRKAPPDVPPTGPTESRRKATGATRKRAQRLANQPMANLTEDHIRVRAYFLSLERSGRSADPIADWLRAERELNAGVTQLL